MARKTCDELLSDDKREVRLFIKVVLNIPGRLGERFQGDPSRNGPLEPEVQRCHEALMAHLRQEHRQP